MQTRLPTNQICDVHLKIDMNMAHPKIVRTNTFEKNNRTSKRGSVKRSCCGSLLFYAKTQRDTVLE